MNRYLLSVLLVLGTAAFAVSAGADMYDLTAVGAEVEIEDALFLQADPHSTGTGVIQSFLRVQANGTEQGYNTDYSPFEFDEKGGGFTHSLLLSSVPQVMFDSVWYREFLLDINEVNDVPKNLLSLDKLQIFLGSAGDLHGYPSGLGTLIYDLDAGADNWIKLDYNLNAGSGGGDMFAYIPDSLFVGPNQFVYLYCSFGEQGVGKNGLDTSDGYEEWAVRTPDSPPPVIPEPASAALALIGLLPVAAAKLRLRK